MIIIKKINKLKNVLGPLAGVILILLAIAGMIGGYFLGSFLQYLYYVSAYGSTYNFTTGYPFNETMSYTLGCYDPFYQTCIGAGILGIFMSVVPVIVTELLLVIIVVNCYQYFKSCAKSDDMNENNNSSHKINIKTNEDEFQVVSLKYEEHELQNQNSQNQKLQNVTQFEVDTSQTIIVLDSSDAVKLSTSTSTGKSKITSYGSDKSETVSETEKIGNTSYSG